jgi:hypothetical protein
MANFGVMQSWLGLLVQNQLTDEQVGTLLNMADLEECEDYQWARLKSEISVNSFAALTSIPVTVVQGSPIITYNGAGQFPPVTAQYALVVSGQAFAPIPVVANAVASTTLTLAAPYPAPSGSATATLFPLWYSAPGFQQILGVRQQMPLRQTTHEELNVIDAYRAQTASPAEQWAPGGSDPQDNAQFELYPVETTANAYIVYGIKRHVDMVNPTDLPSIPSAVVAAKACAKACEAIYALRGDPRWAAMQDRYQQAYVDALDQARRIDQEKFGMVGTIQDKYNSAGPGGNVLPGFDRIAATDVWPWG